MREQKSKYIEIQEGSKNKKDMFYIVRNVLQDKTIGLIIRRRVGRFMHWCLEPINDTYWSNGCLKEVSKFITSLYSKDKGEKDEVA